MKNIKNKWVLILLFFLTFKSYSSKAISDTVKSVEIQIHLIQKFENGKYCCNAVGIDVINKTGKYIYIPNLDNFINSISVCEIVEGNCIKKKYVFTGASERKADAPIELKNYSPPTNFITKEYGELSQKLYENKRMEIKQICKSTPEKLKVFEKYSENYKYNFECFGFLKPNEVVKNLIVKSLGKLEQLKGNFQISINCLEAMKYIEKNNDPVYPSDFYHDTMGYELYPLENMTSNVVYITIL
jgi:hypothetical protein